MYYSSIFELMIITQGRLFGSSINNYNFYCEHVILITLRLVALQWLKVHGKTSLQIFIPVICTEQNLISARAEYAPRGQGRKFK